MRILTALNRYRGQASCEHSTSIVNCNGTFLNERFLLKVGYLSNSSLPVTDCFSRFNLQDIFPRKPRFCSIYI